MKIFKVPEFNICECARCGTVFQPEAQDDLYYQFDNINPMIIEKVMTRCPTCETYLTVTTVDKENNDESQNT